MEFVDVAITDVFATEAVGFAFVFGWFYAALFALFILVMVPVMDLFWDWIRMKLGYPVSRWVRWVKEQTEVNEK